MVGGALTLVLMGGCSTQPKAETPAGMQTAPPPTPTQIQSDKQTFQAHKAQSQ